MTENSPNDYKIEVTSIDFTLAGDYNILCTSELDSDSARQKTKSFTLTMKHPCEESVLDAAHQLNNLEAAVLGGPASDTWLDSEYQDSKSRTSGPAGDRNGYTFCGDREYTLDRTDAFITFDTVADPRSLTLETIDGAHVGDYICTMTINLKDYKDYVAPVTTVFECNIAKCII